MATPLGTVAPVVPGCTQLIYKDVLTKQPGPILFFLNRRVAVDVLRSKHENGVARLAKIHNRCVIRPTHLSQHKWPCQQPTC